MNLLEVKDSNAMYPLPSILKENYILVHSTLATKDDLKVLYLQVFGDAIGYIGDHHIKVNPEVNHIQHAPIENILSHLAGA